MLTIKQALEMDLAEDLKSEIRQYPLDSALALTQENKLYVIPRTVENDTWFRKEEIYDKMRLDGCEALTDEEMELISGHCPAWNPSFGLSQEQLQDITTLDLSLVASKI